MNSTRLRYFVRSAVDRFRPSLRKCPCCGETNYTTIKRKLYVTSLVSCRGCALRYRVPQDPPDFNDDFYQEEYESGFATTCPSDAERIQFIENKFEGTGKTIHHKLALLDALGIKPGSRILDYGASWGYTVWQLREAGYEAEGFEISRPRARYAREKMNVQVSDDLETIEGHFDAVISIHVLEHLPKPQIAFDMAERMLRSGGMLIAFTPNGSQACQEAKGEKYHESWGRLHPLYLNDANYSNLLVDRPKLLSGNEYNTPMPLEAIRNWDQRSDLSLDLSERELILVAKF